MKLISNTFSILINRDFENINYDDQKTEEYDEDDDERRPVIPLSDSDIV